MALHCPHCGRIIFDKWYCEKCGVLDDSDYKPVDKPRKNEEIREEPVPPRKEEAPAPEKPAEEKPTKKSPFGQSSLFDDAFAELNQGSNTTHTKYEEKVDSFGYLINGKKYASDNTEGALRAIYNSRNINYVFEKNSSKTLSKDFDRILRNHLDTRYNGFMEQFNSIIKTINDRETIFVILFAKLLGELNIKSTNGQVIKINSKEQIYDLIIKTNFKKTLDKNLINIYLFLCDDAKNIPLERDIYFEISKQIFDYSGNRYKDGEVIFLDKNEEIKFGKYSSFTSQLAISEYAYQKNLWLRNVFGDANIDFRVPSEIPNVLVSLFKIDIEHADSFLQNIRYLSTESKIIYFEDITNPVNKEAYISNSEQRLLTLADDYINNRFSKNSHQAKALMALYFLFRMGLFDASNCLFKSLGEYKAANDTVVELAKGCDFDSFVKEVTSKMKPTAVRFLGKMVDVDTLFIIIKEMSPLDAANAISVFMDDELGLLTLAKIYNVKFSSKDELQNRLKKIIK